MSRSSRGGINDRDVSRKGAKIAELDDASVPFDFIVTISDAFALDQSFSGYCLPSLMQNSIILEGVLPANAVEELAIDGRTVTSEGIFAAPAVDGRPACLAVTSAEGVFPGGEAVFIDSGVLDFYSHASFACPEFAVVYQRSGGAV